MQSLDAGADDYVVKPFGVEELMARIRASLRRVTPAESIPPFLSPDLKIDFEAHRPRRRAAGAATPKEFELLRQLMANYGKAIAHRRLVQTVSGPDFSEETEWLGVFFNRRLSTETRPVPSPIQVCPHRAMDRLRRRRRFRQRLARQKRAKSLS